MLLPPAATIEPKPDDELDLHEDLVDAVRSARAHARAVSMPDEEAGTVYICRCGYGTVLAPCDDCLTVEPDDPRSDAEIAAALRGN